MQRLALLLSIIAICGCTTTNHSVVMVNKEPYHYIDSAFKKSYSIFEYLALSNQIKLDESNLSMTFGLVRGTGSTTVGYCMMDELGVMVIKIHEESYALMDPYEREALLMHEMAHCLLSRPHCKTKNKKGQPISIMYPTVLDGKFYKKYRKELLNELFNPDPRCQQDDDDADEINGSICTSKN